MPLFTIIALCNKYTANLHIVSLDFGGHIFPVILKNKQSISSNIQVYIPFTSCAFHKAHYSNNTMQWIINQKISDTLEKEVQIYMYILFIRLHICSYIIIYTVLLKEGEWGQDLL